MKKILKRSVIFLSIIVIGICWFSIKPEKMIVEREKIHSTSSPKTSPEEKKARADYFFRMLRDPATNAIPANIRQKELAFAGSLRQLAKTASSHHFSWDEAGPVDVGGRTRALAVDITDPDIIIAGGVSGGIWKSTNNGNTWTLKNDPSQHLSITSLAQDTRPGQTDIWYYASGEAIGNSALDRGYKAWYYGSGLYKSTDNGETWVQIQSGGNSTSLDTFYDFIVRVRINPATGTLFLASNGWGILRSDDDGQSFTQVLGSDVEHYFSDIVVTANGQLVACVSEFSLTEDTQYDPGIYKSVNDGLNWTNITPSTFPDEHGRSVLAAAPSNPNIVYVLTYVQDIGNREDVRFHRINLMDNISTDLTGNLPDLNYNYNDYINTQGGYNMVVAVKPDDENFIIIGGTSLFRSRNGFSTNDNNTFDNWIGGYFPDPVFRYPNLHPDQHIIAFDPTDPNKVWCGHDGGLSYCQDITAPATRDSTLAWEDKNNGYITTQFYTVAISDTKDDPQIAGGTQDNGTPYYQWAGKRANESQDASGGDGATCYFGDNYLFTSWQYGNILRFSLNRLGFPDTGEGWSIITPKGASGQMFIHPFTVDPADEDIMYYPAGQAMWRNNAISSIPDFEDSTDVGWMHLTSLDVQSPHSISTLAVSTENPPHRLYFAASASDAQPLVFRLDNASTSLAAAESIDILSAAEGAYVHEIAVNPEDGSEILVIMSNYNIIGLFHSTDGGATYKSVEGNLKGNTGNPGPSLRSASILPTDNGPVYILGTSIGCFTSDNLEGENTTWIQESPDAMGNVVVAMVTSRKSDHRAAAGTHGRGIWIGELTEFGSGQAGDFTLAQNYPNPFNHETTILYNLSSEQHVNLTLYNELGQKVRVLVNDTGDAGLNEYILNGDNLPSGVYLYTLETAANKITKKLLLIK